jgi:hypothetical protein
VSFIHRDVLDEVKASGRPVTSSDAGKADTTSIIAVRLSVPFLLRVGYLAQVDLCSSVGLPLPVFRRMLKWTALCITWRMYVYMSRAFYGTVLSQEKTGRITDVQFYRWTVDSGNYLLNCAAEWYSIHWPLCRKMYLNLSLKKTTILPPVPQNGIPLHYESVVLRNHGPRNGDLNVRPSRGTDVLKRNKRTEWKITRCYRHASNPTLQQIPLVHIRCWVSYSLKYCY